MHSGEHPTAVVDIPIYVVSGPSVSYIQLLTWPTEYMPFSKFLTNVILIFLITEIILFHHDDHDFTRDIYVQCYSFWPTVVDFMKLYNFGSVVAHLSGCFCPLTFFWNIELNMMPSELFTSNMCTQVEYSSGEFQALRFGFPCGVWGRSLTTWLLYVGLVFWNILFKIKQQ